MSANIPRFASFYRNTKMPRRKLNYTWRLWIAMTTMQRASYRQGPSCAFLLGVDLSIGCLPLSNRKSRAILARLFFRTKSLNFRRKLSRNCHTRANFSTTTNDNHDWFEKPVTLSSPIILRHSKERSFENISREYFR